MIFQENKHPCNKTLKKWRNRFFSSVNPVMNQSSDWGEGGGMEDKLTLKNMFLPSLPLQFLHFQFSARQDGILITENWSEFYRILLSYGRKVINPFFPPCIEKRT